MNRVWPLCRSLLLVNAADSNAVRVVGSRIAVSDGVTARSDVRLDLRGDRLLPGLINAHDHLQLNTLPPLDTAKRYMHVRDWIYEVDERRRNDPHFASLVAQPRDNRLLVGGIKNLLSGVTTVAHHDPLYPYLLNADFPTRVLTAGGWSHSLYLDGDAEVRDSCFATPLDQPWIIHAAEGTDAEAVREFDRLEDLGCLRPNTLIVHGIALDSSRRQRLQKAGAGLIWCPSSNLRLFGRTAEVEELVVAGRAVLGTDSRLSGARDLLEELRVARTCAALSNSQLESMVTRQAAALLRLMDRGSLQSGYRADLVVLPAGAELSCISRADIRLVILGGVAVYADEDYAQALAPGELWSPIQVDGRPKMLARPLADALAQNPCVEPGLDILALNWRAA
jgi:cytosine/adenosine deaminase-related metal-dependent hydrolase